MLKRFIDIILSFIGILFLSPMLLIISCILVIHLRGMPIFFQKRLGYKNKVFYVLKFKTMTNEKEINGELKSDAERLTSLGKVIRNLSLDELPQLVNVFLGHMSIIGPRPFLAEYFEIYTDEELKRHNVRPGITGWAQVNGRNNLTWKEKFKLDLYYINNISLSLDVKILLLTIKKVLNRESVSKVGHITMEKYNGKN
ncbi:MAG: undecaprenyl phosphate N,N'-diacetylbacillosamine 1-phosphate transferase [Sediminicola sp.]|jgi:undecaprenyl phosphate N,N'-diacetylbacillosamine 1-phosphate transferase